MQIPGDNNQVLRLTGESPSVQPAFKQVRKPDNNVGAALESGFEAIINKALTPIEDSQLIEKARMELREGRLESELAFEQAADNLFKYGL